MEAQLQKVKLPQLNERFMRSIRYAMDCISNSSLNEIQGIRSQRILYGSCAKQETKYNSDVDILIVVSDTSDRSVIKEFRNLRNDLLDYDNGAPIDIRIISKAAWDKNDSIYLKSVHREGITL